jgi:hypothetical protein
VSIMEDVGEPIGDEHTTCTRGASSHLMTGKSKSALNVLFILTLSKDFQLRNPEALHQAPQHGSSARRDGDA